MLASFWINSQVKKVRDEQSQTKLMKPSQKYVESNVFNTNSHIFDNPLASFTGFVIWSTTFKC